MIIIEENYKNYHPQIKVKPIIQRLLNNLDPKLTAGLKYVFLTNSGALNREDRKETVWSEGRKHELHHCNGWYSQSKKDGQAKIYLLVDNIISDMPGWLTKIPIFQDSLFAKTLYHEVGHHIHKVHSPEYNEREKVAKKWQRKLQKNYFWKEHWFAAILLFPVAIVVKASMFLYKKLYRYLKKAK